MRGHMVVPCKTMIAGEYSVLEPGGKALSVAEGVGLRIGVAAAEEVGLQVTALGIRCNWTLDELRGGQEPEPGLSRCFWWSARVVAAWASSARLRQLVDVEEEEQEVHVELADLAGVELVVESAGGRRLPVGSSAALAVGSVRALTLHMGFELEDIEVFRLAVMAHALSQRGGSGYDVAASTMGGWTMYERPLEGVLPWDGWDVASCLDFEALEGTLAFALEFADWPAVRRRPRQALGVIVAHTGVKAETARFLRAYDAARGNAAFREALVEHQRVSNMLIGQLWQGAPSGTIAESVRNSVATLRSLDEAGGMGIYTGEINALLFEASRSGAVAKVSGAGGGDCVVALAWARDDLAACAAAWSNAGFEVIPVTTPWKRRSSL